jgi:hypothetical protein
MKSNAPNPLYFSAYPLKAITGEPSAPPPSHPQSPFLRAILAGKTRTVSRVRVFPMVNPYPAPAKPASSRERKMAGNEELSDKEWYNNYE